MPHIELVGCAVLATVSVHLAELYKVRHTWCVRAFGWHRWSMSYHHMLQVTSCAAGLDQHTEHDLGQRPILQRARIRGQQRHSLWQSGMRELQSSAGVQHSLSFHSSCPCKARSLFWWCHQVSTRHRHNIHCLIAIPCFGDQCYAYLTLRVPASLCCCCHRSVWRTTYTACS